MLSHEELQKLVEAAAKVFGSDGEKIGTLGAIHLDEETGLPGLAAVRMGFLGTAENLVPLTGAETSNGQLYVKFSKDMVKDAPDIEAGGDLGPRAQHRLHQYYSRASLDATDTADSGSRSDEPAEPDDVDAQVGGAPRGQTPESPPTTISEGAKTRRPGDADALDP